MDVEGNLHPYVDDSDSDVEIDVSEDENDPDWGAGPSRPRNRSRSRSGTSASSTSSSDTDSEREYEGNAGDCGRGRGRGTKRRRTETTVTGDGIIFNWKNVTNNDFEGVFTYPFTENSGVQVNTTNFSPVDYFKLFFPDAAIDLMVTETNRYAAAHQSDTPYTDKSRKKAWVGTDNIEIEGFLGLQIAMGMCVKPSNTDYWDTLFWLNKTDYGLVMARNRYQLILSFLHFNDNSQRIERGNEGYNALFKIQPLLDIVLPTFLEYFSPGRELAIDESMVKFKGRIHMKQYLPAKPTKWGFKVFVLADSASHFCLKAKVYTGKQDTPEAVGFSGRVVKELLEGFQMKGHIIFTDSYYTSPLLYKELKAAGIGACGTVIDNRKHFPDQLKKKNLNMKKGDPPQFFATEDGEMLAVSWFDSKRVNLISTVDSNGTMQKTIRQKGLPEGRQITKPSMVENYNKNMGAVDHFDQLSVSYPYPHRSYKWYLPLYHFLVETALVNAYKSQSPENKLTSKKFREKVCLRLVEKQTTRRNATPTRLRASRPLERITERQHFLDKYTKPRYKPDCVVCKAAGKRSQTCTYCPDCSVPLCMIPCFKLYHTVENYGPLRRRQLEPHSTPCGSPTPSSSSSNI